MAVMEYAAQHKETTSSKRSNSFFAKQKESSFFSPVPVQPKLAIGPVDDPYEREADAAADSIMRMNDTEVLQKKPATIQRTCASCAEEDKVQMKSENTTSKSTEIPASVNRVIHSSGQRLDSGTKAFMQQRFGYDFSDVQIHNDAAAHQSSAEINALAYTHRNHVVFNERQYQPTTTEGKYLLAHELAHVIQGSKGIIRRAAVVRFVPPSIKRENPLLRFGQRLPVGYTELKINNTIIPAGNLGAEISAIASALTPPLVSRQTANNWSCNIDPNFSIETSAEMTIATQPGTNGWAGTLTPAVLNNPTPCSRQSSIPVVLTGKPDSTRFGQTVEKSEREHVHELETLHNRHFKPYHRFVAPLAQTDSSDAGCRAKLTNALNDRLQQAAIGFALADVAEARKYDDPSSTHLGIFNIVRIHSGCSKVEMEVTPAHPQSQTLQPGNVATISPVVQSFATADLTVNGSDVMNKNSTLRSFSSPQNASAALNVMNHYGITSIHKIGPFEYLMAGQNPPSGAVASVPNINIDPSLYQVSIGYPNYSDWVISQVTGAQYFLIVNFAGKRDEAYSAIDIMRGHGFTKQYFIGNALSPELMFFTV